MESPPRIGAMAAESPQEAPRRPSEAGQRVRALRRAHLWTQLQLAVRAGVEPATIYRIESGRTRAARTDTWARLARALDTTPEALLGA